MPLARRVHVDLGARSCEIRIGSGLIESLGDAVGPLAPTSILIVSNDTVAALYGAAVHRALAPVAPLAVHCLPDGEQFKTLAAAGAVIESLIGLGADRRSVVVALGGGVVGDVAGFAAAIFMRGIRVVQVPTTLLAQVDSSVGGKTGVNLQSGKNLIGAFHQPSAVVADVDVLGTLPPRELAAGLAEVIKHGLLADADYFAEIERDMPRILAREPRALVDAIAGSCTIKAAVVGRDERESGERALLNLGHTFGHAIETMTGYSRWLHGEAVACGLCLAADLSRRLGMLASEEVGRIEALVRQAGLPARIEGLPLTDAMTVMRGDKKAEAGRIRFIVLERIGRAVQRAVPDELVAATLAAGGFV